MLAEYNNKQAEANKDGLDTANAELLNVATKISTIIKLVAESGIAIGTVKNELVELEERKHYLEKLIRELTLSSRETLFTEEMIAGLVNQSRDFIKAKNLAECRQFIKTYINKVVVSGETVEVLFNINIPNENIDGLEPIKSVEDVKELQREYKAM